MWIADGNGIMRMKKNARQFKELTMSEFIEPFLCDLEKYLSKEEQGKLLTPWTINQTREQFF